MTARRASNGGVSPRTASRLATAKAAWVRGIVYPRPPLGALLTLAVEHFVDATQRASTDAAHVQLLEDAVLVTREEWPSGFYHKGTPPAPAKLQKAVVRIAERRAGVVR